MSNELAPPLKQIGPNQEPSAKKGNLMSSELENEFDIAMENIYYRAKDEVGYTAKRFFDMLTDYHGIETARKLVNADKPSDGYTVLWMKKRLDLTVEALVIQEKWKTLFEPEEIERARNRLREYEYEV